MELILVGILCASVCGVVVFGSILVEVRLRNKSTRFVEQREYSQQALKLPQTKAN